MAGYWVFTNLTTSTTFEPRISGLTINNAQPCALATLTCTIDDPEADQVFDSHHAIRVTFNGTKIFEGTVQDYSQVGTGPGPRSYQLTAQDYTDLLGRCIIDRNRKTTESVEDRVNWILDHFGIIPITRDIASISDEVDELSSLGMTAEAALRDTATEVGGSNYIDYDAVDHFFVTPPVVAAPFDIRSSDSPDWTSADPPISGLVIKRDSQPQANAILVTGTDVAVWVEDATSIAYWAGVTGGSGRYEAAINDPSIKTPRRARRVGNAALAALAEPQVRGRVVVKVPGLEPMQTVHVDARTHWTDDADFIVTSTQISYVDLFRMEMAVEFADRFTPCNARNPSAADLAQGGTDPGDDGDGGEADGGCIDCQRVFAQLDSGFDDTIALAFGATLNVVAFDGATLAKYRCNLSHMWTVPRSGSAVELFGHEPGSGTPVLTFPYAVDQNGDVRWDRSGELANPSGAVPMDRPRFWVAGEAGTLTQAAPYGGYGTWDFDEGPSATPVLLWRCFATNGAAGALRITWGDSEIYKGIVGGPFQSIDVGVRVYSDPAWNDPDDPPDAADVLSFFGAGDPPGARIMGNYYVGQQFEDWTPISAGTNVPTAPNVGAGQWTVIYAYTTEFGGGAEDDGGYRGTLTVSDNGSGDALGLDCDSGTSVGASGPVLQVRSQRTGALIDSTDLDELPAAMRATPNAQHLFLRYSDNSFERYGRDLSLDDTVTISGFATSLQDWNVDDDYNLYRLAAEVLTKYNRDGEELWSVDLNTAEGYNFSTESAGNGQQVYIDEHVRIAGYHTNNHAMLLTVGRPLGQIRSVQKFRSDGDAKLLAVARNGQCLVLAGKHDGTTIDDDDVASGHWLMRIWAARAE